MKESTLNSIPYISGRYPDDKQLLFRYLPPVPDGVVSEWLKNNLTPGALILDPFGASPRTAIEAAREGYRVIVAANNPISRFLLEIAAAAPRKEELQSALAELAASYKAEDRIEPHIRSLYNTRCARCGQIISADEFYWEQGSAAPYMRVYTCPFCSDSGEHPVTPFDVDQLKQFSTSGLHKARALERVVASSDQDRIHVEQALSVYLPRALYALLTIVNKIEGLNISPSGQKNLLSLLLYAFDQANVMWRVPGSLERRRQLTTPRHFRESNIWVSLERGVDLISKNNLSEGQPTIPTSTWPVLPPESGGICIHDGRLASIRDALRGLNIQSVCTVIPRPNQAFWTLSALWAGWLWGREAVGTFKSVLHRQRYDWAWHTTALVSVFKQLPMVLGPTIPIFGMIGEAEPGFIASILVAARLTGFDLKGIAIRNEEEQAQMEWTRNPIPAVAQDFESPIKAGSSSARFYLLERGEPGSYLTTFSAGLISIIQNLSSDLADNSSGKNVSQSISIDPAENPETPEITPSSTYTKTYNTARDVLSYRSGFLRFNLQEISSVSPPSTIVTNQSTLFSPELGKRNIDEEEDQDSNAQTGESESIQEKERPARSSDISETDLLWLRDSEGSSLVSISDKYELSILNYLSTHPRCTFEDIDREICNQYQGLFTPDPEFVQICFDSYGEDDNGGNIFRHLREEDYPSARQIDLDLARDHIHRIGARLGLRSEDHIVDNIPSTSWLDDAGEFDYRFFPITTANISEIVHLPDHFPGKGFIVLPGSRSNLIIYKLRHNPLLNRAFSSADANWRFIKLRHLRSLVENPILDRYNLNQLLQLDPLTFSTPQLRLI